MLNPDPSKSSKTFKIINSLHKKNGPFEAVFLMGDAFSSSEDFQNLKSLDVPVYCQEELDKDIEREVPEVDNLLFLGRFGTYKLNCGLTVGYISGRITDYDAMYKYFDGKIVDILLTFQWPKAIAREKKLTLVSNEKLDPIVSMVQPRYHFAVGTDSGKYLERDPFKWKDTTRVTRFISLAKYGREDKWCYAFKIGLSNSEDQHLDISSENPFENQIEEPEEEKVLKRSSEPDSVSKKRARLVDPSTCFFCLSNPKVATYMIISISSSVYLTVAKGPLTFPRDELNFSGHGIIIAISHVPTLRSGVEDQQLSVLNSDFYRDILKYQLALIKMFQSIQTTNYCVVFFEISRSSAIHYHIQFVPIPTELIDGFETQLHKTCKKNSEMYPNNVTVQFEKLDETIEEDKSKLESIMNDQEYILFTVAHSESKYIKYIAKLPKEGTVDLQLPRKVLSYLLSTPKRSQWQKCVQPFHVEEEEAQNFRIKFKPYDFTMNNTII